MDTRKNRISGLIRSYINRHPFEEEERLRREVSFYWTIFSCLAVISLTLLAYLIGANIIGKFGFALLCQYVVIFWLYRTRVKSDQFTPLTIASIILTAGVFIILCGGISHSGGLVFVGLYCIFIAALNRNMKRIFLLIGLYLITIVTAALLDPLLTVHPDMTTGRNITFFAINAIWMSTTQVFFIMYYFGERQKFETQEVTRLKELDDLKNRLFTNITHEFRTPLTLILGLGDQVRTKDEKSSGLMHTIRENARKLLRLVNQMLSLSKLDSGIIEVHNVKGDIIRFIEFIVHAFEGSADTKQIELKFEKRIGTLEMDFDPQKLEEVVTNLLSNALRYTDPGGRVVIQAEMAESTQDGTNDRFVLCVKDNGVGIPADRVEHIFDRFYRVQDSRHHQEGSGIGLTLVRENIKIMGGEISVKSEEGIGSTFTISLPITRKAETDSEEWSFDHPGDPSQPEGHFKVVPADPEPDDRPIVLVIEDNPDMAKYIGSLIELEYRVVYAGNGKEGLKMAEERIPDIILSDVMMPEMDGFEFLGKLKSNIRTSHIPVVMLTAKADMQSRLEGLELGAEAYLAKPFDQRELKVRLKSLLDQRALLQKRFLSADLLNAGLDKGDAESRFISHVHEIFKRNLDNPDFNVDALAHGLGMSRTQLYRKFRALTNTTADRYLRKFRLQLAMQLFKTTEMNVTEVALEVGMPNPSYFSRVFKEEFGHSPSEISATS